MIPYLWKGKEIGKINSFNELLMFKTKEHKYRMWNSIGMETEIIMDLINKGIKLIKINYTEDGVVEWFKVNPEEWLKSDKDLRWQGKIQKHLTLPELRKITGEFKC